MYKNLIKELKKVKTKKDINGEVTGQLIATFINASTQLLENVEPDMPYEEMLNISRANMLRIYDQAIYSCRVNKVDGDY